MKSESASLQATRPYPTKSIFKRWSQSSAWLNLLYVPALILFVVFIFYPFIKGVQISFTNWNGYNQTYKWIGWSNYKRMMEDPDMGTYHQEHAYLRDRQLILSEPDWPCVRFIPEYEHPYAWTCANSHLYAGYHQFLDYGLYLVFLLSIRRRSD